MKLLEAGYYIRIVQDPVPRLLKYVDKAIPPFEAVAVFQQFSWGNACNGGPIWFLGIHKSGTFTLSNPIDFCGGPSPMVTVTLSRSLNLLMKSRKPLWTKALRVFFRQQIFLAKKTP